MVVDAVLERSVVSNQLGRGGTATEYATRRSPRVERAVSRRHQGAVTQELHTVPTVTQSAQALLTGLKANLERLRIDTHTVQNIRLADITIPSDARERDAQLILQTLKNKRGVTNSAFPEYMQVIDFRDLFRNIGEAQTALQELVSKHQALASAQEAPGLLPLFRDISSLLVAVRKFAVPNAFKNANIDTKAMTPMIVRNKDVSALVVINRSAKGIPVLTALLLNPALADRLKGKVATQTERAVNQNIVVRANNELRRIDNRMATVQRLLTGTASPDDSAYVPTLARVDSRAVKDMNLMTTAQVRKEIKAKADRTAARAKRQTPEFQLKMALGGRSLKENNRLPKTWHSLEALIAKALKGGRASALAVFDHLVGARSGFEAKRSGQLGEREAQQVALLDGVVSKLAESIADRGVVARSGRLFGREVAAKFTANTVA